MSRFYVLTSPAEYQPEAIYGRPEWSRQFRLAEWRDGMKLETIECPSFPEHRRSGVRSTPLRIKVPSAAVSDFTWTWYSECLVTDAVLNTFRRQHLRGFKAESVDVEATEGASTSHSSDRLWELIVTGNAGSADSKSGIVSARVCSSCDLVRYSSYQNGITVDEANWDGTDFFTVSGYPKLILIPERVRDLISEHKLNNCVLIPSEELRWPDDVIRPEVSWPALRGG